MSGSHLFQSHVGPAILIDEGSSQVHDLLLNVTSAPMGLETTGEVVTKPTRAQHHHSHEEGTDVHDMYTITQLGVLIQVEGE